MPLRAIVFDFDGVIANSEPLHLRAFQEVLADRGLALSGHDYYERYLGFDDVGVFRAIGSAHGTSFTPAEIDALVASKAAKIEALEEGVSILFPGAADAIRRARAAVPLAIASGSLGTEIRRVLDRERLISFFAAIISAEDVKAALSFRCERAGRFDEYVARAGRVRRRRRFCVGARVGARRRIAHRRRHPHVRRRGAPQRRPRHFLAARFSSRSYRASVLDVSHLRV